MRIVDLDSITSLIHKHAAAKWVAESFVPIKTDRGFKNVPGEAIYFFSTTENSYQRAKQLGFTSEDIPEENYWTGPSIVSMLSKMIDELNVAREKYGMSKKKKFDPAAPSRVWVLTNRELGSIEKTGAIPLPMVVVRKHGNV